jgi:hypothetical protein
MRFLVLFLLPSMSQACDRPICMVDPDAIHYTRTITFDDQASGNGPGRPQTGTLILSGAAFGESFTGQTLEFKGNFDRVTGTPVAPLSVQTSTDKSLSIIRLTDTNVLSGYGPSGYPNVTATGEGSIAVLFDRDQPSLRFDLRGGEGGNAVVVFVRRDGAMLDTWIIPALSEQAYAFETRGVGNDIAGFVITNDDPDGIAFDTLAFEKADHTS